MRTRREIFERMSAAEWAIWRANGWPVPERYQHFARKAVAAVAQERMGITVEAFAEYMPAKDQANAQQQEGQV